MTPTKTSQEELSSRFARLEELFTQLKYLEEVYFDYVPRKYINKGINKIKKEIFDILIQKLKED